MDSELSTLDRAKQQEYYGPEPIVLGVKFEDDGKYSKVLNWYHAMCGPKSARRFLNDFFVKNDDTYPNYAAYIHLVPDDWINFTCAWQARIIMRGGILCEYSYDFFHRKVDEMLSQMDVNQVTISKPSVQDHIADKAAGLVAELEGMIDDGKIYLGWSLVDFLRREGYSATVADRLIDHFEPIVEELLDTINGEDLQLVEGYSHMTEDELLKTAAIYQSLLDGVKEFCEVSKKPRAPWGSKTRGGLKKLKKKKRK